jgi:hypothetical protein
MLWPILVPPPRVPLYVTFARTVPHATCIQAYTLGIRAQMFCFQKTTDRRVRSVIGRNGAATITEAAPNFLRPSVPSGRSGGTTVHAGRRKPKVAKALQ